MSPSIEKARALTAAELAGMGAVQLLQVQQEVIEHYKQAKDFLEWVNSGIAMKYKERAQSCRRQAGKDTGTVHFNDSGVHVTAKLPKKTVWDQQQMAKLADEMRALGEDPGELMKITYNVFERDYLAWPEVLQQRFQVARTVKTGKPVFELSIPSSSPSQSWISPLNPSTVLSSNKEYTR